MVIGSVQSLCRNLDFLQVAISPNMLIVVDEAHHALAPSYRRIIRYVRQHCPSAKLLGLTATPVRMTEGATNQLMELFDRNYIYSISMSDLIASGVMAQPKYIQIDTHVDFKTTVDLEEQKYIQRWGELSPGFMEEMAQIAERNELIVQTYLAHRKEYGKTLIFALNGVHCISLCEELQKHGVRCDYIYSAHAGNQEKIDRFRRNELEVLVNINVMTEGSDVPDIQTVFLTRPTSSDVLLMQMIGRGMRGQDCGGSALNFSSHKRKTCCRNTLALANGRKWFPGSGFGTYLMGSKRPWQEICPCSGLCLLDGMMDWMRMERTQKCWFLKISWMGIRRWSREKICLMSRRKCCSFSAFPIWALFQANMI